VRCEEGEFQPIIQIFLNLILGIGINFVSEFVGGLYEFIPQIIGQSLVIIGQSLVIIGQSFECLALIQFLFLCQFGVFGFQFEVDVFSFLYECLDLTLLGVGGVLLRSRLLLIAQVLPRRYCSNTTARRPVQVANL